jgi:UDP-glucuronate 4-epimerase
VSTIPEIEPSEPGLARPQAADYPAVLVSGCAGFIGSRVAQFLLAAGHTVVGIDNLNDAYDVRLKQWRLSQFENHRHFVFHKLDISDRQALDGLFSRLAASGALPSAIVNLAARAGVRQSVDDPWVYVDTNVTGTLNLLELCRRHGVRKFVSASSSSLYGKDNPMPWREDQETDRPLSPYAASKKAAEALCYAYHHLYAIDMTIFRYFSVYGPAGRPDMAPFRFVQWISEGRPVVLFGDGEQSRDFTYVDDIARGTVAGLRPLGYEVINLGCDQPVTLNYAVKLIEKLVGRQAHLERRPPNPADMPATWADITKARQLLGWQAEVSFEEGMGRLAAWYGENRAWAADIRTL